MGSVYSKAKKVSAKPKVKQNISGVYAVQTGSGFEVRFYNYNDNKNKNILLKKVKKISEARNIGRLLASQYNVKYDGLDWMIK